MTIIKQLTPKIGNGLHETESFLARPGQQPAHYSPVRIASGRESFHGFFNSSFRLLFGLPRFLHRDIHSRMIFRRCSCSGFNFEIPDLMVAYNNQDCTCTRLLMTDNSQQHDPHGASPRAMGESDPHKIVTAIVLLLLLYAFEHIWR